MLIDLKNGKTNQPNLVENTTENVNTTPFSRSKVIVINRYS